MNKAGFIFSDVEKCIVKLDIGNQIEGLKLKFESDAGQWKSSIQEDTLEIAKY